MIVKEIAERMGKEKKQKKDNNEKWVYSPSSVGMKGNVSTELGGCRD